MNTKNGKITWTTEQRRLGDLREWDKNPRQLSVHDAKHIRQSMDTFGLADPLIINLDNSLIGGHQRKHILANPDAIIDVRVPSRQLTEREAEELAIRLNKNTGQWDWDALANGFEFDDLIDWGFTEKELVGLDFGGEPAEDPGAQIDRAEELREKWGVESGQLWKLGDHRLICGDCTDEIMVSKLLEGAVPDLCVTDPPYGVDYDANWRNEAAAEGKLAYAARRVRKVDNDDRADWSEAFCLFPGDVIYTWSPPGDHVIVTGGALQSAGYQIRNQIIWVKPHFPISRGHYTYQHEPCWYAVKNNRTAHWIGAANESTTWHISLDKNVEGGHSTQKPLECMERPIRNHTGDVYDPFVGSGTTIIAAERQKRRCFAMDIDPAYCAVSIQRWVDMTGGEPVLLYNGNQHG